MKQVSAGSDLPPLDSLLEQLKKSEQRYRAFIANSTEGIWCFETETPIDICLPADEQIDLFYSHVYLSECNDALARMYGLTCAEDLIGARLGDFLLRSDERNINYLRAFIHSGYRLAGAESHEQDTNGKDVYFQNNLVATIENGFLKRAWGTQSDITERILLDKRKDEFVSIASHELRTPLTSLTAFTQLLERYLTRKDDVRGVRYIKKIEEQLSRITGLVDVLLDVSKIELGRLDLNTELFPFDDLVLQVIDEIGATFPSHKIIKQGIATEPVLLDKFRVGQVITNLLTNAIKYSPGASDVIVSTTVVGDQVEVRVQDFGIGIPAAQQERVFERFYRVDGGKRESYPGIGLGLYISAEIVRRHRGTIRVESEEGKGSTFIVCFPIFN